MAISFQFDYPTCPLCDAMMKPVQREPHPRLGRNTERVTFLCLNCRETQTRAERVDTERPSAV
jgi:hypothetical protein